MNIQCPQKLKSRKTSEFCPNRGAKVVSGSQFCPECGAKLPETELTENKQAEKATLEKVEPPETSATEEDSEAHMETMGVWSKQQERTALWQRSQTNGKHICIT